MSRVTLHSVYVRFPSTVALCGLDLSCRDGEIVAIFGPSGAGKTTLLKTVAGLESPTEGDVLFDDESVAAIPPEARDTAMAFETYGLYPHMTVRQTLEFPLKSPVRRVSVEDRRARIDEIATLLEIGDLLDRKAGQLSGGQRQRVSLGRALVRRPRVMLLDEPTAHLDARLRHYLRGELRHHLSLERVTTLYATPDYVEAFGIADRVAVLVGGRVEQVGTPVEIFDRPANIRVAELVGEPRMHVVPLSPTGDLLLGPQKFNVAGLAGVAPPRVATHIGLQPEDISMTDPAESNAIRGEVYVTEPAGPSQVVKVRTAGHVLAAKVPAAVIVPPVGTTIGLLPNWERAHFFDAEGVRIPRKGEEG